MDPQESAHANPDTHLRSEQSQPCLSESPSQRISWLADGFALRFAHLRDRQEEGEGRALALLALGLNVTFVHLHDLFDDAQAQPCAGNALDLRGFGAEEA